MSVAAALALAAAGGLIQPLQYRCTLLGNSDPLIGKLDLTIAPHSESGHLWTIQSDGEWLPSFKARRDIVTARDDTRPHGQLFSEGTGDAFRNEVVLGDTEYVISIKLVGESTTRPVNDAAILISSSETFVVVGHVEEKADLVAGICQLQAQD